MNPAAKRCAASRPTEATSIARTARPRAAWTGWSGSTTSSTSPPTAGRRTGRTHPPAGRRSPPTGEREGFPPASPPRPRRRRVRARFTAFSVQFMWLEGSASSIGTCTSGVKDANMAVSRIGGEAGLHARQDRNAGRDVADPGRIPPELLRRRQPLGDQRGGQVHIDEMRSAEQQRANPERHAGPGA